MTERIVADHRRILREGLPLIDLRAPGEFALGAFPGAVNLPLLTDAERAAVGTRYKQCGQQAAIALGEELVSGATRDGAHRRVARVHRDTSRNSAVLLARRIAFADRAGLVARFRRRRRAHRQAATRRCGERACSVIEEFCATTPLLVIAGRTGSGKTELLNQFDAIIDLERLVNHRGSAFGSNATTQPTPIAFENRLAIEMLAVSGRSPIIVEDEGRTIGRLALARAAARGHAEGAARRARGTA